MKYHRFLTEKLLSGIRRSPGVLLVGARQTGKSFLMKEIAKDRKVHYVTFDNLPALTTARHDPVGFIHTIPKPVILDEIQRVPELFLPIKEDIDKHRIPGRYALTGSANPLMVPKLGDSLAGRLLLYELYPLSQGELIGKKEQFLENIFEKDLSINSIISFTKAELIDRITRGGYSEAQTLQNFDERTEWADSYLSLILQKDIQDLAKIEGLNQLPNLLIALAAQTGSLVDYGNLSKDSSIPITTLRRYFQLLHSLFIIHTLASWSKNLKKRLVKSPKVYFVDTLILIQLLSLDASRLIQNPKILGKATENFVILELLKQTTWSDKKIKLFHFHTESHNEIDLILEDEQGKIVAIEIKSSETIGSEDFRHFHLLKEEIGNDFLRGIVLYAGHQSLPFGKDLWAIPIAALWNS